MFEALAIDTILKVHEGVIMVTLTCLCRENNIPMFLRGTDLNIGCRFCGRIYGITKVSFDAATGQRMPTVTVSHVGMLKTEQRQNLVV